MDMRLTDAQSSELLWAIDEQGGTAEGWGDYVRRTLGISRKVGFKMYSSGNIHVDLGCPEGSPLCSPRRQDWLVIDV